MPEKDANGNIWRMKLGALLATAFFGGAALLGGQTFAPSPGKQSSEAMQLQLLTKKIDEQNAKIDILSQQILKLEQQLSHTRPGMMIGEAEPSQSKSASTPIPRPAGTTTHTVQRGETLTSISKMYGVSITELQTFNHIEDPLKLRAGQTIFIPPSPTPAPSPGH